MGGEAADPGAPRWGRVEAVVFDLDGTLYDQGRLRRRIVPRLLLHQLLHPLDLTTLRVIRRFRAERERLAEEEADGVSRLQYERPARALGISPGEVEAVVDEWVRRRPLAHLPRCRYPGTRRLFARLRATGRRSAVVSDYRAEAKLAALGLEPDVTVSGEEPGIDRLKPHPAALLAALDELGVEPSRAVLVGDREDRDGECARRAGVAFLHRRPGAAGGDGVADYRELCRRLGERPRER